VTVDNLEMAQFLYLLMNYQKVGEFLGTIGRRGVLLLGRFTPERKAILDGLRDRLRAGGYLPILFDFDRPPGRNFTETVVTLAGLCRFIIADITNPSSAPLELGTIVPHFAIPLVPIINEGEKPFSMFSDLAGRYQWVLPLRSYRSSEELMAKLDQEIIRPALALAEELEGGKGVPVVPRPL
jgi:hypothetical protein